MPPQNKELLAYAKYLAHEKNYSKKTVRAYYDDIRQYLEFIEYAIDTAAENEIRLYIEKLNSKKYARNSIIRKIAAVRNFYRYLVRTKRLKKNPFSYILNPKKEKNFQVYSVRHRSRHF